MRFHDRVAGNASGPASGPQTQMAQNLVLSWLAGGRIMELKTVQVNDELKISRPCIDAANIGYNVEWSQELRVAESLDQYVQGAMLIHMLRHAPDVFGHPFGDVVDGRHERRADLRHVDRLRPGRHPNAEGRRFHSRHDRRPRKRRAAARPDSALARAAARARLSDRAEPQHHALHVPRLPGRRDRADLRVPAHRARRPRDREDESADARHASGWSICCTT